MSRVTQLVVAMAALMSGVTAFAAENAEHAEHAGVEPQAAHLGGMVTNSMITAWIVAIVVIVLVRLAIRRPKLIPSGGQAVVESLVTGVLDLTGPIVGNRVAQKTLPLLIGLFIYILAQNWSGLFPGVGTIYVHGHELIRPANADLNSTIALALVSMICWFYFIMRYAGPVMVAKDLFGNKADPKEVPTAIYIPLFVIFFAVGIIEVISIIFRPISLSFRLFGNVFGGENLLHAMSGISRWGLPIPFYFLELLIGFVQALVFVLLVSVYIGLICNHGDEHHEEGHAGDHH